MEFEYQKDILQHIMACRFCVINLNFFIILSVNEELSSILYYQWNLGNMSLFYLEFP